jgi:tagatose 6-phosphate kinase
MPPEIYGTLATYATEAGIPTILDAGGHPLHYGAARRPALVIPDPADAPSQADAQALLTTGVGAVALLTDHVVHILTSKVQWQANIPTTPAMPPWPRDALVAGLVPGVLLNWSWPDRLRHAVALAASATSSGEIDLPTYEHLVAEVQIDHPA